MADLPFALARNGVLYNDKELRGEKKLPATKIETDSYVAVQLLEQQRKLNFSTIRNAAESLRGTLTLTILDSRDELYIVKGNNPLTLYHFPRLGLYVYASTEAILKKGVKKGLVRAERPVEVELNEGEILRIDRQGRRKVETFNTENLYDSRFLFGWPKLSCGGGDDGYVRELKSFAGAYGYTAKDVDTFLSYGMYPEEIEEIMCCGEV